MVRRETPFWGKAPGGGKGTKPTENFQDFMIILDPESTCKWHCNRSQTAIQGVRMNSRLILRLNKKIETLSLDSHNCKKPGGNLQSNV